MKKNISSDGLTREIKKWIASFTKEEWRKKLEEEKYLYELNKVKNLEWFSKVSYTKIVNDISHIECEAITSKDRRSFDWTSLYISIDDKKTYIPISYVKVFPEAA